MKYNIVSSQGHTFSPGWFWVSWESFSKCIMILGHRLWPPDMTHGQLSPYPVLHLARCGKWCESELNRVYDLICCQHYEKAARRPRKDRHKHFPFFKNLSLFQITFPFQTLMTQFMTVACRSLPPLWIPSRIISSGDHITNWMIGNDVITKIM
jgi:hypothetical protein